MPRTEPPDFGIVDKPTWQNGSAIDGFFNNRRVTSKDDVKGVDINELRQWMELLAQHEHSYTDSVGKC